MTVADLLGCARVESRDREKNDFYKSPAEPTVALLKAEGDRMPVEIWECCCGDGAISKVLRAAGKTVIESDLVPRGVGVSRIDFLLELKAWAPAIVTNCPWKNAVDFIAKARLLGVGYLALLLKADFLNSQKAMKVNQVWPVARVYPLSWRPDWTGDGSPPQTCSWFIWDGDTRQDIVKVLEKPYLLE